MYASISSSLFLDMAEVHAAHDKGINKTLRLTFGIQSFVRYLNIYEKCNKTVIKQLQEDIILCFMMYVLNLCCKKWGC
jgi:hypothetical protein